MAKQQQPKPFKPVTFKGPFTQVIIREKHLEYTQGILLGRRKGYIEYSNIASLDYAFMTNKLRVGSKDGVSHEFQLFKGDKCRDLIMKLKLLENGGSQAP